MSLKRKYDFDQVKSSSTSSPEDDSVTTKYIKTDEFFNDNSHSSDERKCIFLFKKQKNNFNR